MPYSDKLIKRDQGGKPIPQIWDADIGDFIPYEGKVKIEGTADVKLIGSIPEYGWVDGDTEPTPTEFAFGVKVDPVTNAITSMYWDGSVWTEVS